MTIDSADYGESTLIELRKITVLISRAPIGVVEKLHDEIILAGMRTGKSWMSIQILAVRMICESVATFLRALCPEE